MQKVKATIKGISALLMHAFPMVPIVGIENKSPEEQAELSLYRLADKNGRPGEIYVPGNALQRCIVAAGAFSKGKGRATLVKTVAACVFIEPDALVIKPQEYTIDSRRVIIAATRGAVVRHRPRFDEWEVDFNLSYDETLLKSTAVRKCVDDAGQRVGLLDFRPACKGPFGRFVVTSWKS